jgi:hypothetical protein
VPRETLQLNGQIVRHRTLQPSDRALRRMAMTRLRHFGCAISITIAVIPSGGRTRFRNALGAGTWLTTRSANIIVAGWGVLRAIRPN